MPVANFKLFPTIYPGFPDNTLILLLCILTLLLIKIILFPVPSAPKLIVALLTLYCPLLYPIIILILIFVTILLHFPVLS